MKIALKKRNEALQHLNKSECQQAKKSFSRCLLHFKQAERYMTTEGNRFIMDKAKADIFFRHGETNFLMTEYSDALSDYMQVEALACAHNRSFNDSTAEEWMINEVGLHPNQLFTSKIQALCQLLRYEDAVEVLCTVKHNNKLCQYLVNKVLTPVVNQHIGNGVESFGKQKWENAKADFNNAKRFLSTFNDINMKVGATMTLNAVESKLNAVESNLNNDTVAKEEQPQVTVKKELSELAFLMSSMNQNQHGNPSAPTMAKANIAIPVTSKKGAMSGKTFENDENMNCSLTV